MRGRKPLHLFMVSMLVLVLAGLTAPAGANPEFVELDRAHGGMDDGLSRGDSKDASDALADLDALTSTVVSDGDPTSLIKNLEVVGRGERLLFDGTTDVWAHRGTAYIGTFQSPCGTGEGFRSDTGPVDLIQDREAPGVVVFDVKNVNKPTYLGNLPSVEGSRINDVKVTRTTSGADILVHSNESCAGGPGGFEIYDMSDPTSPVHLASLRMNELHEVTPLFFAPGSRNIVDLGVHNLFQFSQSGRDYVAAQTHGEFHTFRMFDVTDPTNPTLAGAWGAEELFDPGIGDVTLADDPTGARTLAGLLWLREGFGVSQNRFLHDFTIDASGTRAYLANWDAGLVLLDISDIADPQVISVAIDPTAGDGEVNSHAVWPSEDGSIVVETEEDFSALAIAPLGSWTVGEQDWNTIPAIGVSTTAGDDFEANQTGNIVRVEAVGPAAQVTVLSGSLAGNVYPATQASGNQPRLEDTGAIEAEAVFVGRGCDTDNFFVEGTDTPGVVDPHLNDPDGKIAVVRRGGCSFSSKLGAAQAAGAIAVVVADNVEGSQWGNVRIWDYSDPANPILASEFDTICSLTPTDDSCDPRGTYSVHNVIVEKGKAYFSWYSDGVLILDISDPYNPVETARWNPTGEEFEMQNGGIQDVWGIGKERGKPWLYASDRNGGLYILKEFGSGTANKGKGQGGGGH